MNNKLLFRSGDCEIDLAAREVRVAGRRCALEPRVFSLLAYLAQRPDRVVTRSELLQGVWPGERVTDAALARAVMKARQALGDAGEFSPIRTVPRIGYRFVGASDPAPRERAPHASLRVAILPFDNATGDPSLDWVGLGLMSLLAGAMGPEPGLTIVVISAVLTAVDGARAAGADAVASVRAATGAEVIVRGRVTQPSTDFHLALAWGDGGTAGVSAPTPGELGPAGARALAAALRPGTERPPPVAHEGNPLATTAFARALQAQAQQRFSSAVKLLRMAHMLSPGSAPVRLELLRALCGMGDLAAARPIARSLLAEAQRRHDVLLTARVHLALARAHMYAQAFEPAVDHLEQGLYWLGEGGPPEEVAYAQLMRAQIASFTADHAGCELALERMRAPCETSGNRLLAISRDMMLGSLARARGNREQAADLTVRAAHSAEQLHCQRYQVTAGCNASTDLVLLGRWSEAAAHTEQAFAAALQSKDRIALCTAVCNGTWAYMVMGVPAAAQRLMAALPSDEELSSLERLWAASARSHEAASAGRHAQAVEHFTQAMRLLRSSGNRMNESDVLPWLLRSLVHCGRLDEAEAELAAVLPLPDAEAQAARHHCEALLAHAGGRPEPALHALRRVVDDPAAPPLWRAWAVWDAAWLLAEVGRGAEARAMLQRLPARFDALPLASAVTARVRLALGEDDAPPHCQQPAPPVPCLPSRL